MKCNEVLTCIYFEYIVYRWVFLKRRVHTTAFILHIRLSNSKLWIRFHGICEYTLLWYVSRNRNERHFGQQTVYLTDFKMEEVLISRVFFMFVITHNLRIGEPFFFGNSRVFWIVHYWLHGWSSLCVIHKFLFLVWVVFVSLQVLMFIKSEYLYS